MAVAVAAARLTEAHRLAQARVGAQTVRQMLSAWPLLDPSDLDGTFDRWFTVIRPLVGAQRASSARLASNYLTMFRQLELGPTPGRFVPTLDELLDPKAFATSMLVTGVISIRSNLGRGVLFDRAVATAQANTARAAMRHAMDGGRGTISATVAADPKALGYARAASGKACHFCAMLAGRGPVYSESSVHFDCHDGCSCTAEPVYRSDAPWPAGSKRYAEIYNEATRGAQSPAEARNAFRKALAATG